MNTTLIFVELLSAGSLATVALLLAMFGLGLDPGLLQKLGDMEVTTAIVALALVYPIGVVLDGVADRLFSTIGAEFEAKYNVQKGHSVFSLLTKKDFAADFAEKYFDYNRVRTRIVRSFLLNSILMLVSGLLCGIRLEWGIKWLAVYTLAWLGVGVLTYWSLRQLREAWFRMLAVAWGDWPCV